MSFAQDNGYIPSTVSDLMNLVRVGINTQFGTDYDSETFVGTNFYKYFYALIQRLQENEVKTSEIVLKLQQYFASTNEVITRPNTTHPGLFDYFAARGYVVSSKPPADADAGKLYVAVDVKDNHAIGLVTITSFTNLVSGTDDSITVGATVFTAQAGAATVGTATFQAATSNALTAESLAIQINGHATAGALVEAVADGATVRLRAVNGGTSGNSIALAYTDNDTNVGATVSGSTLADGYALEEDELDYNEKRLAICNIIKDCVVAGVVTQGTEVETITLSNDQSFDFKYNLPDRIPILLRLTLSISANNKNIILTDEEIRQKLFDNISARYRLGLNFEPQRYFSVVDAPWAGSILLEWSDDDGGNWHDEIFEAEYDELFTFEVGDIKIVQS